MIPSTAPSRTADHVSSGITASSETYDRWAGTTGSGLSARVGCWTAIVVDSASAGCVNRTDLRSWSYIGAIHAPFEEPLGSDRRLGDGRRAGRLPGDLELGHPVDDVAEDIEWR